MNNAGDQAGDAGQSGQVDPSEAAKTLGRLGGLKGGKARAEKLTSDQKSEIAKKGAQARWGKGSNVPDVTHGDENHPLRIGGMEIPCYVLEDGRRVLAQNGMIISLGMSHGSASGEGRDRLARFATGKGLNPFIPRDLIDRITNPIQFRTPSGNLALGYEATILADLCEAVLAAREAKVLQKQQHHIAKQCEILVRGFARVGIVALVDEATGYQYDRSRRALEKILEQYLSKDLAKWTRTFEREFYENMFRLKGWRYTEGSSRRPKIAAQITLDLVYRRLAPNVLTELQKLKIQDHKAGRKGKLFQHLTENVGHPKLREHLAAVTALMKSVEDGAYEEFYRRLNRALPKFEDLPLFDQVNDRSEEDKIDPPAKT